MFEGRRIELIGPDRSAGPASEHGDGTPADPGC